MISRRRRETAGEVTRPDKQAGARSSVRCEWIPAFQQALEQEDGQAPANLRDTTPPLSRFDDHGEVARGGMGQVRRVFDKVLLREVAMKVMHPIALAGSERASLFLEEAQITGQLDHPNIVPVYDLGVDQHGSGAFFTMKLVDGTTLCRFVQDQANAGFSSADLDWTLEVLLKVCDAVAFAHSRGVVHRDLKPENIMIGTHGQVYVMDWGIALLMEAERPSDGLSVAPSGTPRRVDPTCDGGIAGTPDFMAPEQAWGRLHEIDERTDVFGLGGILYFLLTGSGPNTAPTVREALKRAMAGNVPKPEEHSRWELPSALSAIAMKALSPAREDRYVSVAEFKADLERYLRAPRPDPRLDDVAEVLLALAHLDFTRRLTVGDTGDTLDAIAVGINMLAEELEQASVLRQQLLTTQGQLREAQTQLDRARQATSQAG
jgi:serine/threonine-protein kinase